VSLRLGPCDGYHEVGVTVDGEATFLDRFGHGIGHVDLGVDWWGQTTSLLALGHRPRARDFQICKQLRLQTPF
jgi:hypothetical protein